MKRYLVPLLLLSLAFSCFAAVPLIDFSKSHSLSQVVESGVDYKLFESRNRFIRIEDQDVRVRFPGGRSYTLRVDRGSFDLNDQDQIISSRLITTIMPTSEAADLMRNFKRSFAQPTNDVDRWVADVGAGKQKQPFKFKDMSATSGWKHYPAIIFGSKSSQNPTYEWNFVFTIRWTPERYPEDWNEQKAAIQNQKPPAGYEMVSLDPPSGRFYSVKEGLEIATGLDLDWVPTSNEEPEALPTVEPEVKESAELKPVEVAEEIAEQSSLWWLWLFGALVVVGGLVVVVRRKS